MPILYVYFSQNMDNLKQNKTLEHSAQFKHGVFPEELKQM